MHQVVLASSNIGKLREIGQLLEGLDIEVVSQSDFNVPDIEETGKTFIENALLKARNASQFTGLPAIADDSGIAVDVLQGKPGIYSARYAGIGANDEDNLKKLISAVKDFPEHERDARFICSMVYVHHAEDPTPLISEGVWKGRIVLKPIGENGFGYDPIFYVESHKCTSAQLAPPIKNKLSHRGQALRQLMDKINVIYSVE